MMTTTRFSNHEHQWSGGLAIVLTLLLMGAIADAQEPGEEPPAETPPAAAKPQDDELSLAPTKVDVKPIARDDEIRRRLENVLTATGWFTDPQVEVEEGVVFLSGQTESADLKKWAGDLARNTQDVVAVANRLEVPEPSIWDFRPAWDGLLAFWRDIVRSLPFVAFGFCILILSVGAAMLAMRLAAYLLAARIEANLLRNVLARGAGVLTFLCGAYVILRVSGLTQLALTVVGGTGLLGLVFGIAFRDITENFLASIFLSMQRPFETGDLVEAVGVTGYVQQLNVRTTILMTLDGNLVQIPNASLYKSNLRNFTANANRREDFVVGIGYDDSINQAQEIARKVLEEHPAILNDPEPSVLADSLGNATINLRIYFWLNGREHSWMKVRSSVIRLVKSEFQKHGISMPDEAREVVFPHGVPVTMVEGAATERAAEKRPESNAPTEDLAETATKAEGGLTSDACVIEEQARQVQPLQNVENLLKKPQTRPGPGAPVN